MRTDWEDGGWTGSRLVDKLKGLSSSYVHVAVTKSPIAALLTLLYRSVSDKSLCRNLTIPPVLPTRASAITRTTWARYADARWILSDVGAAKDVEEDAARDPGADAMDKLRTSERSALDFHVGLRLVGVKNTQHACTVIYVGSILTCHLLFNCNF